jgi:hypothetical protein
MLRTLFGFVVETLVAILIALGYVVYPEVEWLHNIAWVAAVGWTSVTMIVTFGMGHIQGEIKKVLSDPNKKMDDLEKGHQDILKAFDKRRSSFHSFFNLLSGIAMIVALAASGWFISAVLFLIFGELLQSAYRSLILDQLDEYRNRAKQSFDAKVSADMWGGN